MTNALVLVHRRQLMEQWIARLNSFLDLPESSIGRIGGGKRKAGGIVETEIALLRKCAEEVAQVTQEFLERSERKSKS